MRRSDREITDFSDILAIINSCKVIRLAMVDHGKPYLVPLNFGVIASDETLTFYCHSALEGRKIDILRENPEVFFELDTAHQLVLSDDPCHSGFRYASVMGDGVAEFLSGEEKLLALSALMRQQAGREIVFTEEQAQMVAVFAIRVKSVTAKQRK